jgi:hypothetical protein
MGNPILKNCLTISYHKVKENRIKNKFPQRFREMARNWYWGERGRSLRVGFGVISLGESGA